MAAGQVQKHQKSKRGSQGSTPQGWEGFSVCKKLARGPKTASTIPPGGLCPGEVLKALASPNFLSCPHFQVQRTTIAGGRKFCGELKAQTSGRGPDS